METAIIYELIARFQALSDNAYVAYIGCLRKEECFGWQAKVDHGTFGHKELQAHEEAAEWLGKHRAYASIVKELKKLNERTNDKNTNSSNNV